MSIIGGVTGNDENIVTLSEGAKFGGGTANGYALDLIGGSLRANDNVSLSFTEFKFYLNSTLTLDRNCFLTCGLLLTATEQFY